MVAGQSFEIAKRIYMAPHSHTVTEQDFVLEGKYTVDGEEFVKAPNQIYSPHDEHGPFESKEGALVLVIWDALKS